jgi:soluble lytic murein transglycosylase
MSMRRGTTTFLWAASVGALVAAISTVSTVRGPEPTGSVTAPRSAPPAIPATADLSLPPDHRLSQAGEERAGADSTDPAPREGLDGSRPTGEPDSIFARLNPSDLTAFAEALAFYKTGDLTRGDLSARAVEAPALKTALEWVALRKAPREAGFERLQSFATSHADWPGLAWMRKRSEEALLGDRRSDDLVKSYFAHSAPQTPAGKLALAAAWTRDGELEAAARLVRSVWREDDVNAWLEAKIRTEFASFLQRADHKYRADRLLYKTGQSAAAMRAAKLAGPDMLALAKARASVLAEAPSERAMAAVPPGLRSDPGYLFSKVQTLRRSGKIREAADVLLAAPREKTAIVDGDQWWIERRLVARKILDLGEARTAYRICAEHAADSGPMKIEAEFHAGWIALRFLHDPTVAATHFAEAAAVAETPMSRARAAYWQGRAAEAAADDGAPGRARFFYELGAAHPATFYGQLARAKLGMTTIPIRSISDEARGDERSEAIRAIELLFALDEKEMAEPLVMDAARGLSDERQVAALATIVVGRRDARLALAVGKITSQRGFALDTLAFPAYGVPSFVPLRNSAPASIVYSIARQESAFNAEAVSPAGARGLMQMMPATARSTAARASVAFDPARLVSDPAFNAQLGAAHLGDLLDEQKGSCILAFAAYNAGAGRVKEWVEAYGDPRKPDVDPIDWIERIPFTETRNYVQRVTENLQVYRVRFGEPGGSPFDRLQRIEAKL